MRAQVFDRLVTLELDFYVRRRVGELISRLSSDVTQVRTMLTQTLTSLLSSLLSLIGSDRHPVPAQPHAAGHHPGPGAGPGHRGHSSSRGRCAGSRTRVQDAIAASTTTAEEALSGIRVVKSFGREDWERHRYGEDLRGVVGTRHAPGHLGGPCSVAMMTFLGFGALIIILWYTGRQVIEGTLDAGRR